VPVSITENLMDINKIIDIIHNLKEEGEGSIANVVGNGEKSLGYNIETGTPPVDLRTKNTKNWNIFFKGLVRRNRKKQKKQKNK
jgi:hypothetical protein